jgi:hypothetical protein
MPLDGAALVNAATNLLGLVSASLTEAGVSVPARSYIAPGGSVAADGEQLVVVLSKIEEGQPGMPGGGYNVSPMTFNSLTLAVSLLRPVPTIKNGTAGKVSIPSASQLNAAGTLMMTDSIALWNAARSIKANPSLLGLAPNQPFVLGPLTPYGPDGGIAGHTMEMAWSFDG